MAEVARPHAGKVAIRHVIEAAKAGGIDVASVQVHPDGTIRVYDARSLANEGPDDQFDRLLREGGL
jgi:hypothetical protein